MSGDGGRQRSGDSPRSGTSQPSGPPPLAQRLLARLLPSYERDEVLGDLAEHHAWMTGTRGRAAADRWYLRQAIAAPIRMRLFGARRPRARSLSAGQFRIALRSLVRDPGYALVTVVTLALGIGASTAVYAVVDAVLLEPLPWERPDKLVSVMHAAPGLDLPRIPHATGLHVFYGERSRSFESMALFQERTHTFTGGGEPQRITGAQVTPSLFRVLRAEPRLGRTFTEEEGRPGPPWLIVLSDGLWVERFGADPDILGRTTQMDGIAVEIVGVMPPGFAFPDTDIRFWYPLKHDPDETATFGGFNFAGVARLVDGATPDAAQAELAPLLTAATEVYGNLTPNLLESGRITPVVKPLIDDVVGDVRTPLWILLGTVGFVLLIACANVANLSLVRAEGRQGEWAVRTALGAGRADHAARLLVEGALLAGAGAAVGAAVAWQTMGAVRSFAPVELPRVEGIEIDASVLTVAVALTAVAGGFLTVLPLLRPRRGTRAGGPRLEARGATGSRRRVRLRSLLVASQVAFAVVLLVGSGLMVRSFRELLDVDLGFDGRDVLTFQVSLPRSSYTDGDALVAFHSELLDLIEALPGVEAAGLVSQAPLRGVYNMGPYTPGHRLALPDDVPVMVQTRAATPGYFDALRISLLAGRYLEAADADRPADVALVSERTAELFFPDREAVGGTLADGAIGSLRDGAWLDVIGVVGDARYVSPTRDPSGVVYLPMMLAPSDDWMARAVDYTIRTAGPPESIVGAVRSVVRSIDPELPLAGVRTMASIERDARAHTAVTMVLLLVAAGVGLLLGAVGLYGVLSYVTARRTREVGVRVALGAGADRVRLMVLRQGLGVTAVGLVIGLAAAWALSRFMTTLLVGVSPTDPLTYAVVSALLLAVATSAVWIPAHRASRVDPVEALRAE